MNQTEQALTINDYLEGRVTLSELIKYATNKVLTQEGVAFDTNREVCMYLASSGATCVVGTVLPERVQPEYSECSVSTLLKHQFGIEYDSNLSQALQAMQNIHDCYASRYGFGTISREEFNRQFSSCMHTFEQDYPQFFVTNSPD